MPYNSNVPQPKEMEVCPVCGAFLVVNDAEQRVQEHLQGKHHSGYAKVRATVQELKVGMTKNLCTPQADTFLCASVMCWVLLIWYLYNFLLRKKN